MGERGEGGEKSDRKIIIIMGERGDGGRGGWEREERGREEEEVKE